MCGIVGLIARNIGGFYFKDRETLEALLVNDTQRGKDSTGAFCAHSDGHYKAIKVASNPFNLFATKEWGDFGSSMVTSGRFAIGHNRAATRGKVTSANAHPFQQDHIVMVHNGTLRNWESWGTKKEVDSSALCAMIAEQGYEKALADTDGAFALAWYDMNDQKLRLVRNSERPLTLTVTESVFAIASESWMAQGQMMRLHMNNDKGYKVEDTFLLPEGVMYEFDLKGKLETRKVELWKPKTYVHNDWQGNRRDYKDFSDWEDDLDRKDAAAPPFSDPGQKSLVFKDYKLNSRVQFEITKIFKTLPMGWSFEGRTVDIIDGVAMDVCGSLPLDFNTKDFDKWKNSFCVGTIVYQHVSNCGPSMRLNEIKIDTEVETFNDTIGAFTWKKIVEESGCEKCAKHIDNRDAKFTNVNLHGKSKTIVCHECLEEGMPSGKAKDAFVKHRDAAVQARIEISEKSGGKNRSVILAPSTTTPQ